MCLKDVGEIGLCLNIRKLTGWWKKGRPKDRLVEEQVAKGLFICANLFEKKGCAEFGAEERSTISQQWGVFRNLYMLEN